MPLAKLRAFAVTLFKVIAVGIAVLGSLIYGLSYFWPVYEWDIRIPSPDKSYNVVVLLGDKAAFDDFFYNIYVFPKDSTPHDRKPHTRVWYAGDWRSSKYLVYSGYSFPGVCWTGLHSLEIDAEYWSGEPLSIDSFYPLKRYGGLWPRQGAAADEHVIVSLVYNKKQCHEVPNFIFPFDAWK